MPATLPPPNSQVVVVQRTTTAYSQESKSLYDLQRGIMKKAEYVTSWQQENKADETGIYAEADLAEPKTVSDLAEARSRFLASVQFTPLDADLPVVLLSEG